MAGESQGASPFEISTVAQKGGQVITPEGELDLTTVPLLEQRLNQALLAGDTVLELSVSRSSTAPASRCSCLSRRRHASTGGTSSSATPHPRSSA